MKYFRRTLDRNLIIITTLIFFSFAQVMAHDHDNDENEGFIEGYHYVVLDPPAETSVPDKIEVVEAFSYGCPHCFELEPDIMAWKSKQKNDVHFRQMHAVWNDTMRLYAQMYYALGNMGVIKALHIPIFNSIHVQQQPLSRPRAIAEFVAAAGFDQDEFMQHFRSPETREAVENAARNVKLYSLSGVPQLVVNGKYRVDPVRADGRRAMLDVVDYLVQKERAVLSGDLDIEATE